jgi:hypothetical protein
MTNIIEMPIRAGELPPRLRGDFEPDAMVLMSVRRLTANGFTDEFEDGVLRAEKEAEGTPFRPAADVLKELRAEVYRR